MPPLFTTRSWILRSIWRMLSTSVRTLSHSRSTMRAEKRICISSAEIFFCSSRYFGALWPSFVSTASIAREVLADRGEVLHRGDLQPLEVLARDGAGVGFVLLVLASSLGFLDRASVPR